MDRTDSMEDLVVDTVLCAYGGRGQAEFARLVGDLVQWLDHRDGAELATYRIPTIRMDLNRAILGIPSLIVIWKWNDEHKPYIVGMYRPAEHLAERLRIRFDLSDQHKTEGG